MKEYKNLKRVACEELEEMDKKYEGKHEFTKEDAVLYKDLMKAKYYQTVIEAMEKHNEEEEQYSESFANRPRNDMGQFTSREMEPMYSGHYMPRWMYPRSYGMPPEYQDWGIRGRNW